MNHWPNRFVSLALLASLAACQSAPSRDPDSAPAAAQKADAVGAAAGGTVSASDPQAPVPERAAQEYARALKFMQDGRLTDAELELKQLTVAYPEFAGPYTNLGIVYERNAHLADAEVAFKAAIERNPKNPIAGNELAIVQRKLGKFMEAESSYQRTIAAAPDYAPTYLNLGVLYDLYLGEPQKALTQFERYLQMVGENKQVTGWVVELRKRAGVPAPGAPQPATGVPAT